jgi:hypothetical protein
MRLNKESKLLKIIKSPPDEIALQIKAQMDALDKANHWTSLLNVESKTGEWELLLTGGRIELYRFNENENNPCLKVEFTEESWRDFISLILRVTNASDAT